MDVRIVALLLVGFLSGFALPGCGSTKTCGAANCPGCCDQAGQCQLGSTPETCGSSGAICSRCGVGTVCQFGECSASFPGGGAGGSGGGGSGGGTGGGGTAGGAGGSMGGGTGGGAVGGGTGGAGGGSTGGGAGGGGGGCRQLTSLPTPSTNLVSAEFRAFVSGTGHYNFAAFTFPQGSTSNALRLEVVYPNDVAPAFPYTENFNTATRYANCTNCAVFSEGCTAGTCSRTYLAQGGSMTTTRADRAPAGRLQGSASNVRFNEWDVGFDTASGTGCIIVTTLGPWDIGWNADGGMPPP